jgi:predicted HD phosphohydrolase
MQTHDPLQLRATFSSMREITTADCRIVEAHLRDYSAKLPDRVLQHLKILDGDYGGYPVHRLEHCLQTATRALRDGRDEEYVVCALLHDIGDTLATHNHADVAAAILKPFVSERMHWIVEKHTIFQGYYLFHFVGVDRNMRDRFHGEAHFEACEEFCEKYDQCSFDASYRSLPLEQFEPLVRRVFARPRKDMTIMSLE